ncbi:peptidoglycan D,D-transpeptidase FtsI family protein [Marinimicrococcus flavescens]|uniref:Penicillin-binding protein 2 n=1 Tax=Marinimicrococcus flavescens TaxID=3031815 RepID=A0AAP4D6S5_9PROT|nr:penicillin-binding protein 2 [Marinimicrococcus flavescens]
MKAAIEHLANRQLDPSLSRARGRLRFVGCVFAVAFASIAIRLVDMLPEEPVLREAPAQAAVNPRARPPILDRNGTLLATDLKVASVYADPSLIRDLEGTARKLSQVLVGVEAEPLLRRLRAGKRFAWVKHQITPREEEAVLRLGLPGVAFQFAEHRVYPKEATASHVVGFVDIDNRGLGGIEYALDSGSLADRDRTEPLRLSLDLRVQHAVLDEMRGAMDRFQAVGACGIVMDVRTGELLSMVSLPDFDPNHVDKAGSEQRKNRCSGQTYELGSLFKIFSTAVALDSGRIKISDRFDATRPLRIGRHTIRDDHAKKRWLSVPEIFMYSSNIGTAKMVFDAGGGEAMKDFLGRLGLLERGSLEVPELASPQVPSRWPEVTTATVSFGHGIAVTPLQFVEAMATLSNDGARVRPTLLRVDDPAAVPRTPVVRPEVVDDVRWMMWLTVAEGTGSRAGVDGYLVGGKTGSADKVDYERGGYRKNAIIASFAGVFPIEDPRYAVLVMLDEPRGDKGTYGFRYGGWTAAPVVSSIISRAGPLLGVQPSTREAGEIMEARRARVLPSAGDKQREKAVAANGAGR